MWGNILDLALILWVILWVVRVPLAFVLVPQAQDLLVELIESPWRIALYMVLLFFVWASTTQYAARLLLDTDAGILLNEYVAGDGPTVFEHAYRLGAEGIVSKRVDGTYRSGPCAVWIKVRNPASIAVQRERSENWNR
jgi:hypothetical protein